MLTHVDIVTDIYGKCWYNKTHLNATSQDQEHLAQEEHHWTAQMTSMMAQSDGYDQTDGTVGLHWTFTHRWDGTQKISNDR